MKRWLIPIVLRCGFVRATEPDAARPASLAMVPHGWNGGKVSPCGITRIGYFKLIRFHENGREELYSLRNDPGEQHNLAGHVSSTDKRPALAGRLDAWLKEAGAQTPVPRVAAGH